MTRVSTRGEGFGPSPRRSGFVRAGGRPAHNLSRRRLAHNLGRRARRSRPTGLVLLRYGLECSQAETLRQAIRQAQAGACSALRAGEAEARSDSMEGPDVSQFGASGNPKTTWGPSALQSGGGGVRRVQCIYIIMKLTGYRICIYCAGLLFFENGRMIRGSAGSETHRSAGVWGRAFTALHPPSLETMADKRERGPQKRCFLPNKPKLSGGDSERKRFVGRCLWK